MIRIAIRMALIIVASGFFLWLFDQNIPFAGVKKITYTFSEISGPVSEPYPRDRTHKELVGTDGTQTIRMVEDPLYFDVRSKVDYEYADIILYFRNESDRPAQLGMRIFGDTWKTIVPSGQRSGSAEGGWNTIQARFDLQQVPRYQNTYTFLISVPGLRYESKDNESLVLSHADIRLIRKPLF